MSQAAPTVKHDLFTCPILSPSTHRYTQDPRFLVTEPARSMHTTMAARSAVDATTRDEASSNRQSTAALTVLSISELLEAIILELPPEDILLAANVCTTWRDLILSSIAILKHLRSTNWSARQLEYIGVDGTVKRALHDFADTNLSWGVLLIRRVPNFEVMCILSPQDTSPPWLAIHNRNNKMICFEHVDGYFARWQVEFHDVDAGKVYTDYVGRSTFMLPDMYQYLDRYHKRPETT